MNSGEIIRVFNDLFKEAHNTILCGGADEPLYKVAHGDHGVNEIWFREDYASSALHEISHWCIAGPDRRQRDDYGYWYIPNRNADQQALFELVEAVPQGLEWVLSVAADVEFRVSSDNFDCIDNGTLRQQIQKEALHFIAAGIPARARQLQFQFAKLSGVKNMTSQHHFEDLPR